MIEEKQIISNEKRHKLLLGFLACLFLLLTVSISFASIKLFTNQVRANRLETADGAGKMAAHVINGDKVNEWLNEGRDFSYEQTYVNLKNILDNTPNLTYLYVYQIKKDGCHVVLDIDNGNGEVSELGDFVEFDPTFLPYVPNLLKGEYIEDLESNDSYGWLLTHYEPLFDSENNCVAYVGTDVSMVEVRSVIQEFVKKIVLVAGLFFIACLAVVRRIWTIFSKAEELDNIKAQQEREKALLRELVETFAKTIDMKDTYTQGHSSRVAIYTARLAKELGYDDETVDKYYNIALLHDFGKIGIPDEILNKPGKLDDREFNIIKSHASRGYEALKNISLMPELGDGAGFHHERPDGKGYPRGLKGDEIPRVAQIIALADTFDAMYSNRPYRKCMPFEEVVTEIKRVKGTQLTDDVVDAFLRLVDKGVFSEKDGWTGPISETDGSGANIDDKQA